MEQNIADKKNSVNKRRFEGREQTNLGGKSVAELLGKEKSDV